MQPGTFCSPAVSIVRENLTPVSRSAMFEDSTFESANRLKKRNPWVIATFSLNAAILAAAIIYPLINYEALPKAAMTMMLV